MTERAQVLIHSAVIWSAGRVLPHTAIVVRGGFIAELGGDELRDTPAERVINARGGLVTPSFGDAHVHALWGGIEMNRCDLTECENAEEVAATIRAYAEAHPDAGWILGGGWRMPFYKGGTPLASELDRIVPDRPVYLLNSDHHGGWVNTKALEIAGIDAQTPDPEDGVIERDAAGNPTGTLHEGATELLAPFLPAITEEEARLGLLTAQQRLHALGITTWQEAILGEYGGYPDHTWIYRALLDEGKIQGNATGALWTSRDFDGATIPEFVEALSEKRARFGGIDFNLNTVKIMVDGVPENQTAALLDPYHDPASDGCGCSNNLGLAYFSREELLELVPLLNEAGFNAHMHAIGDRAVRYALDAIEAVPEVIRKERRNHIAHIQIVHPDDVRRFAELNVTANIQALWAARDEQMEDLTIPLLGDERTDWHYPFKSILHSGAELVCGSDWPVSTPDPWQSIHVAVNRREPGNPDMEALVEREALTLVEALTAYTTATHQLLGSGSGRIEAGEHADLAIADRNPLEVDRSELHETRNTVTMWRGEILYEELT